jgi:hypothetical protein
VLTFAVQVGVSTAQRFFMAEYRDESWQSPVPDNWVITFEQFRPYSNVPFEGLVGMLNMDLSEFPNRGRNGRY